MGRLTDDMTRLRGELDALSRGRAAFIHGLRQDVDDMKDDVINMRAGFRNDLDKMATELTGNLGAFTSRLKDNVSDMQATFRHDRSEMAETTRADLAAFASDIKAFVAELADQVGRMRAGFRSDLNGMSAEMKDKLGAFSTRLKTNVADMQETFRHDRSEMAEKTKADLAACISDIKEFVAELADQVGQMRAGFRDDQAERAKKGKTEREAFMSGLYDTVLDLRQNIADLSEGFAADISGARQAWHGPTRPQTKAARGTATKKKDTKHQTRTGPRQEKNEKQIRSDDLTRISGLGPARVKLLTKAGYYTFAKVAKAKPEDLQKVLGSNVGLAGVTQWIRQANELTS